MSCCSLYGTNIYSWYGIFKVTKGWKKIKKRYVENGVGKNGKELLVQSTIFFLMAAIPMCLGTTRIRQYPSNTIYSFIIRVATCFDPTGSLSGLHYEPINVKNLRTFLGSQTMFTIVKYEKFVSNGKPDTNNCKHCLGPQECTQHFNINWFIM